MFSRPRKVPSLKDWSPRPPTSSARPTVSGGAFFLHAGTSAAIVARTRSARITRAYRVVEPDVNSGLDGSRERGEVPDRVHPENQAVPDRRRGEGRVRAVETLQQGQVARVENLEPAALVVGRARLDHEEIADRGHGGDDVARSHVPE